MKVMAQKMLAATLFFTLNACSASLPVLDIADKYFLLEGAVSSNPESILAYREMKSGANIQPEPVRDDVLAVKQRDTNQKVAAQIEIQNQASNAVYEYYFVPAFNTEVHFFCSPTERFLYIIPHQGLLAGCGTEDVISFKENDYAALANYAAFSRDNFDESGAHMSAAHGYSLDPLHFANLDAEFIDPLVDFANNTEAEFLSASFAGAHQHTVFSGFKFGRLDFKKGKNWAVE